MKYNTEVNMCATAGKRETFNTCYYSHERQKYTACAKDPNNKQTIDDRFQDSSMRVSQYSLYNEGGVISKLLSTTNYIKKCPNYVSTMSNNKYPLWTRANIKWSLECEATNGLRRDMVYRLIESVDLKTDGLNTMVVAAALIMMLQIFMVWVAIAILGMKAQKSTILGSVAFSLNLILFFVFVGGYTGTDADFTKVVNESNKL